MACSYCYDDIMEYPCTCDPDFEKILERQKRMWKEWNEEDKSDTI